MIGKTVGHYCISSKLGTGGMGEVFLAEDARLDRKAAIEFLPADMAMDPARRERLLKEARAASALNHPHVCVVYDVGETDEGIPFIAMEFVGGQTLDALVGQGPLAIPRVVEIAEQVADALDAAHAIDADARSDQLGWGIAPEFGAAHQLILRPGEVVAGNQSPLTFVIRQNHFNANHEQGILLGRFRLSATSHADAFDAETRRMAAGDVDGYQAAVAKLDQHLAEGTSADEALWLVFASVAGPSAVTKDNRDRLLGIVQQHLAGSLAAWQPRLTAALYYRAGQYQQAADLFDENPSGPAAPAFGFLAAMAQHQLGNQDKAKKLLDSTNAWMKKQQDKDPGPAAPTGQDWRTWAIYKSLQRETQALLTPE